MIKNIDKLTAEEYLRQQIKKGKVPTCPIRAGESQTTSDPKVISTWLSVAGDYCEDAAKSLKESIKG